MQSILSRVRTTTGSCRCSLCNPPRATVPRRSTAAARSRRHGAGDAVTVFYGTVLAAALWTDAAGKIGERKRLDRALETTRRENRRLERSNRERLRALGIAVEDVEDMSELVPKKRRRKSVERLEKEAVGQKVGETDGFGARRRLSADEGTGSSQMGAPAAMRAPRASWVDTKSQHRAAKIDIQDANILTSNRHTGPTDVSREDAGRVQTQKSSIEGRRQRSSSGQSSKDRGEPEPPIIQAFEDHADVALQSSPTLQAEYPQSHLSIPAPAQCVAVDPEVQRTQLSEATDRLDSVELTNSLGSRQWRDTQDEVRQSPGQSRKQVIRDSAAPADPSTEAWPIGRASHELWDDPCILESNQYWRDRRELVISLTICRLIRLGMDSDHDFAVDLGLDEAHPLQSTNLSKESLDAEIAAKTQAYSKVRALVKLRKQLSVADIVQSDFPRYMPYEKTTGVHDEAHKAFELNSKISEAFASSKDPWKTLACVCEAFAHSETPPNIHTFNLLLINFARLGLYDASRICYDALQACGVTKNEITAGAMLQVYSETKMGRKFNCFASEMDARSGKGLINLDQSTAEMASLDPEILTDHLWVRGQQAQRSREDGYEEDSDFLAEVNDVSRSIHAPGDVKRVLRMPLTHQLYEHLIVGYNNTGQARLASLVQARMEASGFQMSAQILNSSLRKRLRAPGAIWRCREETNLLVHGRVPGSMAELTESVYLLFHIWTIQRRQSAKAGLKKRTKLCDSQLEQLNDFAKKRKLLNADLHPREFVTLNEAEQKYFQHQLDLIRRLEKPVLSLKFDAHGVQNLTIGVSDELWTDCQPHSLRSFVEERLAILHESFIERHTSYPNFERADGQVLGFAMGQATMKLVKARTRRKTAHREWQRRALARKALQKNMRQVTIPLLRSARRRRGRRTIARADERDRSTVETTPWVPTEVLALPPTENVSTSRKTPETFAPRKDRYPTVSTCDPEAFKFPKPPTMCFQTYHKYTLCRCILPDPRRILCPAKKYEGQICPDPRYPETAPDRRHLVVRLKLAARLVEGICPVCREKMGNMAARAGGVRMLLRAAGLELEEELEEEEREWEGGGNEVVAKKEEEEEEEPERERETKRRKTKGSGKGEGVTKANSKTKRAKTPKQ